MTQQDVVNEQVAEVALRGEAWWHDPDNSLRAALQSLPVPQSVKLWVADVAVQAWTEGAITAVQEYGDEMRERAAKSESEAAMVRHMLDGPPRLVGIDYGSDGMTTEWKVELQADGSIKVLDVRRTPEPSK